MTGDILNQSGSQLDSSTREFMESRFRYDFSNVRIHTNENAARSAQDFNAMAYTIGNRVVFGKGQYSPNTVKGRKVLAHELAHVVQQHRERVKLSNQQLVIYRQPPPPERAQVESSEPGPIRLSAGQTADVFVAVPDLPGIPKAVRGQEVKFSTVKKAIDKVRELLSGRKDDKGLPLRSSSHRF